MPGDVSVYVRIRPPLAGEPREAAATVLNKETVRLEVARTATVCEHGCDAAFGPHAIVACDLLGITLLMHVPLLSTMSFVFKHDRQVFVFIPTDESRASNRPGTSRRARR